MRILRSHPKRRLAARTMALLMLVPSLIGVGAPAQAQARQTTIFVLDFNNKTTVGGALLGRTAAAQVSLQLAESQNWDLVPDSQVQRRMGELNLKAPFDRANRYQIATGIDATACVYGNVVEARIDGDASVKRATVRIEVLVEDVNTGVLINGAVAEGRSTPRMGFNGDQDVLIEEAIGKAAFTAREFMDRFRLPEGTVLNTNVVGNIAKPELECLVNIGARQGVRRGMEMVVTRINTLVGRVRILSVDSDVSNARVIENVQGVKPEDRVRAIFNFSDFSFTRQQRRAAAEKADSSAKIALVGAEQVDGNARVARIDPKGRFERLAAPQDGVQISQITGQVPPPVIVDEPEVHTSGSSGGGKIMSRGAFRMLVGGLLLVGVLAVGGRGSSASERPHGVVANSYQLRIGESGAKIKVCWERPKTIKSSDVLQYVIWRGDNLGNFEICGALDTDTVRCFIDTELVRTVNAFDGSPGTNDAGSRTAIANVPGLAPGRQYRYQIATAFEFEPAQVGGGTGGGGGGGGGQNTIEEHMSPLSQSSPWVTAITAPLLRLPVLNQQVDLGDLEVSWDQSLGCDQYVIMLSKSSSFPDGNRVILGPFDAPPGQAIITQTQLDARNNKLSGANRVYISVGARNTQDGSRPIPHGAVFSQPVAVQVEVTPPPPPGMPSRGKNRPDRGGPERGGPVRSGPQR